MLMRAARFGCTRIRAQGIGFSLNQRAAAGEEQVYMSKTPLCRREKLRQMFFRTLTYPPTSTPVSDGSIFGISMAAVVRILESLQATLNVAFQISPPTEE
jgi:hypothetical protein